MRHATFPVTTRALLRTSPIPLREKVSVKIRAEGAPDLPLPGGRGLGRGAERGSAMSHFHLPRVVYRHVR
jgi:hypothetical protein